MIWDGRTPIFTARSLEVTNKLINADADMTATDSSGNTCLHVASSSEITRTLLEAGAPNPRRVKNNDGKTAYEVQTKENRDAINDFVLFCGRFELPVSALLAQYGNGRRRPTDDRRSSRRIKGKMRTQARVLCPRPAERLLEWRSECALALVARQAGLVRRGGVPRRI